jgi:hypothetical protein
MLVALLAACTSSPEGEQPLPPVDGEETQAGEPADDPSPWVEDYTDEQVRAFEEALERLERYEEAVEPIWAAGEATPEAEAIFKDYFATPLVEAAWDRLQRYDESDIQIEGTPRIHWSRPADITETGGLVIIDQCIDFEGVRVVQGGEEVGATGEREPMKRQVEVYKPSDRWLISSLEEPTAEEHEPCEP